MPTISYNNTSRSLGSILGFSVKTGGVYVNTDSSGKWMALRSDLHVEMTGQSFSFKVNGLSLGVASSGRQFKGCGFMICWGNGAGGLSVIAYPTYLYISGNIQGATSGSAILVLSALLNLG